MKKYERFFFFTFTILYVQSEKFKLYLRNHFETWWAVWLVPATETVRKNEWREKFRSFLTIESEISGVNFSRRVLWRKYIHRQKIKYLISVPYFFDFAWEIFTLWPTVPFLSTPRFSYGTVQKLCKILQEKCGISEPEEGILAKKLFKVTAFYSNENSVGQSKNNFSTYFWKFRLSIAGILENLHQRISESLCVLSCQFK